MEQNSPESSNLPSATASTVDEGGDVGGGGSTVKEARTPEVQIEEGGDGGEGEGGGAEVGGG